MSSYIPELLNEGLIDGVHGVDRLLAPERQASLIDQDDLIGAQTVVQLHCQAWGGYCDLMLPCRRGSRRPPAPWMRVLDELEVKAVCGGDVLSGKQLERSAWLFYERHSVGEPLLPLLVGGSGRSESRTVRAPRLSLSDPWFVAYLGIFGSWPDLPRQRILERLSYRRDLAWDDVIPTVFEFIQGGAEDLLNRLRDPKSLSPVEATALYLQRSSAARNSGIGVGVEILPSPDPDPSLVGPNMVVVYEPGSVRDLCLLWALRALHAMPSGLPLAIPSGEPVGEILDYWLAEHAPQYFGLGGDRRYRVVSASLSRDDLRAHIQGRTDHWEVADFRSFLKAPRNPARLSADVVVFKEGLARVATWGPEDRDELTRGRAQGHADLLSAISLKERPLPPVAGLRPDYGFLAGPRGDGVQMKAGEPNSIKPFSWPTGWKVLEAAVLDRGLIAKPSAAGRAGAALVEALGGPWEMRGLLSMPVLELLSRLAERRGMSWFRERARQISHSAASGPSDSDALARVEAKIDQLSLRQFEDEERGMTVDQVRMVLNGNRESARSWVRWAERHQLIIRGVEVRCERCEQAGWRALGEAAPPILCRGCGESIAEPYREDGLVFRYRAGEPLLRAIEHDALTHVLAMRWWCALWGPRIGGRAGVFGGYPGVDLLDPDSGARIGEVDVLLLLADGSFAVGECKRHGVGLNDQELKKLEDITERLDARLSFLATSSWALDCPEMWREAMSPAPSDPPRYVLTGEHLLEMFSEGSNLLSWPEQDESDHIAHHAEYVQSLPEVLGWVRESAI